MRFWVADNVLKDWSSGVICIYAKDEGDAIEQLYKADNVAFIVLYNWPKCECDNNPKEDKPVHFYKHHKPDRLPSVFKLIEESKAFIVWGGG